MKKVIIVNSSVQLLVLSLKYTLIKLPLYFNQFYYDAC